MYWPLSTNSFNLWDKLRISKFILTNDQWTQGPMVRKYEKLWENYLNYKTKAVMVASGSAANELIALRQKVLLKDRSVKKVIFPANTWISSISPWVNFGFEPVFVDIEERTLCMDLEKAKEKILNDKDIVGVFCTTLLGNYPNNLKKFQEFCANHDVFFKLDNCESSFTNLGDGGPNINTLTESSTSFYLSHLTTTGSEGGMIFTQKQEDFEWYLMARSHGMTRAIDSYTEKARGIYWENPYRNRNVDEKFDFNFLGSNYRSSDYAAFPAILDFEKIEKNNQHRTDVYDILADYLGGTRYAGVVPFAFPIVSREIDSIKSVLRTNGVEFRPIVGGNLLKQTAFREFGDPKDFPVADFYHQNGIYIGLHNKVTKKMAEDLARKIAYTTYSLISR